MTRSWREDAACLSRDPWMWRLWDEADDLARDICLLCPVREACLEDAMATEGRDAYSARSGLRGGLTPWQRARLARERDTTRRTA